MSKHLIRAAYLQPVHDIWIFESCKHQIETITPNLDREREYEDISTNRTVQDYVLSHCTVTY